MRYDFTTIMDRRGMDAIAVDNIPYSDVQVKEGFSVIPMWVADMNFQTVPTIPEVIIKRTEHAAYGYFEPRAEYYDSIVNWQHVRNGVEGLTKEAIGYENGVLGGVVSAMNVLCSKGDKILVHAPTYIGFTHSLENNGYHLVLSSLKQDEDGIWRMDYEDMEKKIKEEHIHAAILCSPHNPSGRVWERWELEKAMELYRKYDVYVVSDEIWSDLTLNGYRHIPTQMISEDAKMRTIAMYAPSKTFNLAGLVGSYHIIYNPYLRERIRKESSLSHYNTMNVLSMYALTGGYSEAGMQWVDELRQVLTENVDSAYKYIREHFEGVEVSRPQGTYMLFLDCQKWCETHNVTIDELQKKGVEVGVIWQDGRPFHGEYGIRMNLALPKQLVEEAFERLTKWVFAD